MAKLKLRRIYTWLMILLVLPVVALGALSMTSRPPANLGISNRGTLADCPTSPNCVCSQATDDSHRIEPLAFHGDPAAAIDRLTHVVNSMPRTRIISATGNYLHVEFKSLIFRFTDDVEFLVDSGAKVIQCRSASRVGYSDLGANRRRMESIREAFAAQGEPAK